MARMTQVNPSDDAVPIGNQRAKERWWVIKCVWVWPAKDRRRATLRLLILMVLVCQHLIQHHPPYVGISFPDCRGYVALVTLPAQALFIQLRLRVVT